MAGKGCGASVLLVAGAGAILWGAFVWLIELPAIHADANAQAGAFPWLVVGGLAIGAALLLFRRR